MYQICLHFSHESSVCEWTLPKQYSPSIHLDSKGSFLTEKNDYSNQLLTEMLSLLRRLLEFQKIGKQRALIQGVLRAVDGDTL